MKITRLTTALALAATVSLNAQAHRAWIEPQATVLSGSDPWVSFDAAISNTLFHADHVPMRLDDVQARGPNGKTVELQNANTGKYRSTFDINLSQEGTYKIFTASHGLRARWETEDGERRFWPRRGQAYNPDDFAREVPTSAKNLEISESSRRIETFVTAGSPSEGAFTPSNLGLEMIPLTHPNDLFAGEEAEFQFLIDGEPAVGVAVEVIPGAMRYRDSQDEIAVTGDKEGKVRITWPAAGMYWLSAEYSDNKAKAPAQTRAGTYVATFEVLPD